MSSYAKCLCCGGLYHTEMGMFSDMVVDHLCSMCLIRGGFCVHNVSERKDKRFHYSRPHRSGPPSEPESCQWCLVRFLDVGR